MVPRCDYSRPSAIFILGITAWLASGCQNNYARFFHYKAAERHPRTQDVAVFAASKQSLENARERGLVMIGASAFRGPYTPESLAVDHAKQIAANIVLLEIRHLETRSGVLSVPTHHPGRNIVTSTHHRGSTDIDYGLCYGDTIRGDYSGTTTSTTTTPGYTTYSNVPYNVDIYGHRAYFLRDAPAETRSRSNVWGDSHATEPPGGGAGGAEDFGFDQATGQFYERSQSTQDDPSAVSETEVMCSATTKVFHRPGYKCAHNIEAADTIVFKSRTTATAFGCRPCEDCKP